MVPKEALCDIVVVLEQEIWGFKLESIESAAEFSTTHNMFTKFFTRDCISASLKT